MTDKETKPASHRCSKLLLASGALIAVGLAANGIWSRHETVVALKRTAEAAALPRVQVISPKPGPSYRTLTLPGEIEAWYNAPIYAQVSGYVAHWYKDYGARVKKGDLLATINTPSLDAQYAASKASLAVMQARYKLAIITAKRWAALSGTQAVSQQDVDVKQADAAAQKAQVAAAEQNVAHYEAMEEFKRVVAPFDGVVIARSTDVGDYVNAAGGDATLRDSAQPLFDVADIHKMRIFVDVPQEYANVLRPGLTATLTLPGSPDNPIAARFLTTANAVLPATRTIVTELMVDNTAGKLWPGAYANVHFKFPSNPNILTIPEQALLFRSHGMQVAVLRDHDRVHLQDVSLGHNMDADVQILAGLQRTDKLIADPSLGLLEGQQVVPVQPVPGYQPWPAPKWPEPLAGPAVPSASASHPSPPTPRRITENLPVAPAASVPIGTGSAAAAPAGAPEHWKVSR
jgi:membrane fusion protein, multidrug efflux system